MNYSANTSAWAAHPPYNLVHTVQRGVYDRRGHCTWRLGIRASEFLKNWKADRPTVGRFFYISFFRENFPFRGCISLDKFLQIKNIFNLISKTFLWSPESDWSIPVEYVECTCVINGKAHQYSFNTEPSSFRAEVYAIAQALVFTLFHSMNCIRFCTDSLNVLQSLENMYIKHPLVQTVILMTHGIWSTGCTDASFSNTMNVHEAVN